MSKKALTSKASGLFLKGKGFNRMAGATWVEALTKVPRVVEVHDFDRFLSNVATIEPSGVCATLLVKSNADSTKCMFVKGNRFVGATENFHVRKGFNIEGVGLVF